MNPLVKKKEKAVARDYLRKNPNCTYEQLIQDLGITSLSKPYFFNIRTALRKSGEIPGGPGSKKERQIKDKKVVENPRNGKAALSGTKVEILHSMDASMLTPELREHWKSTVLPVLKTLVAAGETINLVFLSDPVTLEIRRVVS